MFGEEASSAFEKKTNKFTKISDYAIARVLECLIETAA